MKEFKTNTQIVPLMYACTYHGSFSYEAWWQCDEDEEHYEGNFVCADYEGSKLIEKIVEAANYVCESEKPMEKYGVKSIHVDGMYCPKCYNYGGDSLDLTVTVEDRFFDEAEKVIFNPKNREAIDDYIREYWCSRDGAILLMPATKGNGNFGYGRFEDPDLDDMHRVLDILRNDPDVNDPDVMRMFGGVMALVWLVERNNNIDPFDRERSQDPLTMLLEERVRDTCLLGDCCTILSKEEVLKLYPDVALMDTFDAAYKLLDEKMEKFRHSGVTHEAIDRVYNKVRVRMNKIDDYRRDLRYAVECWHPDKDKVNQRIAEVKAKWEAEIGDNPAREKLGELPKEKV